MCVCLCACVRKSFAVEGLFGFQCFAKTSDLIYLTCRSAVGPLYDDRMHTSTRLVIINHQFEVIIFVSAFQSNFSAIGASSASATVRPADPDCGRLTAQCWYIFLGYL